MLNPTKLLERIHRDLGATNTPLEITHNYILRTIRTVSLKTFSKYYPALIKTLVSATNPDNETGVRGKFRIPKDVIEAGKIMGVTRVIGSNQYNPAIGARSGSSNVSFYSSNFPISGSRSLIDVQLFNDLASAFDQPLTWGYFAPNIVEIYPRGHSKSGANAFLVELMVMQDENFFTIDPALEEEFYNLALIDVKDAIYNIRKNYSTISTAFGSLELNLDLFEGMADKRAEIIEKFDKNYWKSRHRRRMFHD